MQGVFAEARVCVRYKVFQIHPHAGMDFSSRVTLCSGLNALPNLGIKISLQVQCRNTE